MKKFILFLAITVFMIFNLNSFAAEEQTEENFQYDANTSTQIMTDKDVQNHIT